MKIEYVNVKLAPNTIAGATITALTAREGVTLTRVIEDGRDDLVISRKGRVMEIAWSQVKGGVRAPMKPALAKAGKPAKVTEE